MKQRKTKQTLGERCGVLDEGGGKCKAAKSHTKLTDV